MSNTWFTSDNHFGHKNIIRFSKRPYNDLDEMHEDFVQKWNSVVSDRDVVYHLGDIAFKSENPNSISKILDRLNGHIYYVLGNHERDLNYYSNRFEWIKPIAEIRVEDKDADRGVRSITLCHYAMRVWNRSHHGAWHLYGHSHGSLPDDPNSLSFDCGVDCHNYTPISYEQVKAIMATKKFKPIDHHGARDFECNQI
jgi:calcineurin-like phosphoesterase family protein